MSKAMLIQGTTGKRLVPGGVFGRLVQEIAEQQRLWSEQLQDAIERLPEARQAYIRGAHDAMEMLLDLALDMAPRNKKPDSGKREDGKQQEGKEEGV